MGGGQARTFRKFDRIDKTYLAYAVRADDVSGTTTADDEVVDARFFTREGFESTDGRLLTSWPREYKRLAWWIDRATAALAEDRGD